MGTDAFRMEPSLFSFNIEDPVVGLDREVGNGSTCIREPLLCRSSSVSSRKVILTTHVQHTRARLAITNNTKVKQESGDEHWGGCGEARNPPCHVDEDGNGSASRPLPRFASTYPHLYPIFPNRPCEMGTLLYYPPARGPSAWELCRFWGVLNIQAGPSLDGKEEEEEAEEAVKREKYR